MQIFADEMPQQRGAPGGIGRTPELYVELDAVHLSDGYTTGATLNDTPISLPYSIADNY